jgi:hypothetical protein
MFLLVVARLATGDKIPFGALPPTDDGHYVVHGEIGRFKPLLAIVADSCSAFTFPPWTVSKFPGLLSLPCDLFECNLWDKVVQINLHTGGFNRSLFPFRTG